MTPLGARSFPLPMWSTEKELVGGGGLRGKGGHITLRTVGCWFKRALGSVEPSLLPPLCLSLSFSLTLVLSLFLPLYTLLYSFRLWCDVCFVSPSLTVMTESKRSPWPLMRCCVRRRTSPGDWRAPPGPCTAPSPSSLGGASKPPVTKGQNTQRDAPCASLTRNGCLCGTNIANL